jgi:hypothetical protein
MSSSDIEETPSWICEYCNRQCKDKKGYTNHTNKCRDRNENSLICPACNLVCKNIYNVQKHLETCKKHKEQLEEQKQKETMDRYEEQIRSLRLTLQEQEAKYNDIIVKEQKNAFLQSNQMIKMMQDDQQSLYKEKEAAIHKVKEQEDIIKEQKDKIKQLEKKNDTLNHNMIEFAKKATDKNGTTIYQTNTNSNVQNGHLQLQHFDASFIRDKIVPPSRMVYDVGQLVEHMHRFGLGNMYRSVDRSRNVIIWKDKDGNEIRDSNCSQLREQALSAMEGDLKRQLRYQQERLDQLDKIEGTEHLDEMTGVRSNILFCQNLLNRNAKVMKELQKEISKKGKNKNDTTVDVPRLVGSTQFISILQTCLFPNVDHWMGLSISEFGTWLGTALKSHVNVEGSVLYKEKKFIVIRNDDGQTRMLFTPEFVGMIKECIGNIFTSKLEETIAVLLKDHSNLTYLKYKEIRDWLEAPKEEISEHMMDRLTRTIFGRD